MFYGPFFENDCLAHMTPSRWLFNLLEDTQALWTLDQWKMSAGSQEIEKKSHHFTKVGEAVKLSFLLKIIIPIKEN